MPLFFRPLHPTFAAEAAAIDLRSAEDRATLDEIRAGMDRYAVLVFRDQRFSDLDQLAFARRFDGELHAKTGSSVLGANRFGDEALTDISNVDENGEILKGEDRRRMYALGNRLWHTDASFQDPPGRYSMLHARVVPGVPADTEFADLRAAYDELDAEMQRKLEGLRAHHSIAYSRETLGFQFSEKEREKLEGAIHPLVRTNPRTGRRSLYLASHASRIVDWPIPEGRLFLRDLIEHATQPRFVYRHSWRPGDLVIWDNLATMHRGRPFDDATHRRELRRVTTLGSPAIGNSGTEPELLGNRTRPSTLGSGRRRCQSHQIRPPFYDVQDVLHRYFQLVIVAPNDCLTDEPDDPEALACISVGILPPLLRLDPYHFPKTQLRRRHSSAPLLYASFQSVDRNRLPVDHSSCV
jgi:alpha-ketoglutarate-dependent 2,4-dichlorophenoxyacetate dioxygenase